MAFGDEIIPMYHAMIDAILTGQESFPCPDADTLDHLTTMARVGLPPYHLLVSQIDLKNGQAYLRLSGTQQERDALLEAFNRQVAGLIEGAALTADDSPAARAIALYSHFSSLVSYDYAAAEDEQITDVTPYRALMDLTGICQSFASAYAYLCLQCGIDACTASGMNDDFIAHEWTLLTLDGQYYYADPTFENGNSGLGLRYFGMTAEQRELEGGFIADKYNIGSSNALWGKDINVTDLRFAPLWEAVWVLEINREDGHMTLVCQRADESTFTFEVD